VSDAASPGAGGVPRRRAWLYRLVLLVAFPLAALVILELGLRVAGYGYAAGFTRECVSDGAPAVCDNPSFTWRFFPREIARAPVSFAFPATRPPSSYRIFVVGGSAAQGDPEPSYGFARILEVLLAERYPDVRFEVVNAGVTAINSHVVLPIVRDLARHDADLFVVYLGNNEVVGPFGAGTIFAPLASSRGVIRTGIRLRGTRLGQLLAGLTEPERVPEEWGGLEMFLDQRVRRDAPRMETLYGHFRRNVRDIIARGGGGGTRVVVSTVGVNLRGSAPFGSLNAEALDGPSRDEWQALFDEGVRLEAAGRAAGALEAFGAAVALDDTHAELQYRIARLMLDAGDTAGASQRFELARDLDVLRFRADGRINRILRELAGDREAEGVHLVDAAAALREQSPHGIPGPELFDDHVHLNFAGNYVVARELLREIEAFLPDVLSRQPLESALLTPDQAAMRLGYTGFDRLRIAADVRGRLERPPFTGQADHAEQLERLGTEIEGLARYDSAEGRAEAERVYRAALAVAPQDPWLRFNHAALLAADGRQDEAASQLRAFLRTLTRDVPGREKLSTALAAAGRYEEAVAECVALSEQEPDFAPPYFTRAFALANLGRFDESVAVYRELLRLDPDSATQIHNEIARIELHRGRPDAALDEFGSAIRHNDLKDGGPIPDLRYNYGVALQRAGRTSEATEALQTAAAEYRRVMREDGPSGPLHVALGSALVALGDLEGASREFRNAVRLAPGDFTAHDNLVRSLHARGRTKEALDAAREGVRMLADLGRIEQSERLRRHLAAPAATR
jgi:tetratricopeptide (TPR) repeat protein